MTKSLRITLGALLVAAGTVFFILPGSILFVLGGLLLLAKDVPAARRWLKSCQTSMSSGARRLDRFLLSRKLR